MPQPSPERTLQDLIDFAAQLLRRRFPHSRYVLEELPRKLKPAPPVATRCREKACPFPIFDHERGLCRGHMIDLASERSVLPSQLASVITSLHGHGYQAAACR
jgi:hypothetical protein